MKKILFTQVKYFINISLSDLILNYCNLKDPSKEKELRGSLKSEVSKYMSKEDVVIFDSMNYIKGIFG